MARRGTEIIILIYELKYYCNIINNIQNEKKILTNDILLTYSFKYNMENVFQNITIFFQIRIIDNNLHYYTDNT